MTDYGLAPINANAILTVDSPDVGHSRWLAPEIIDSAVTESLSADIFAYGMVGVAVLTGKLPFEDCCDVEAASQILKRGRPERPQDAEGVTLQIWRLFEGCWNHDPARRPTIEGVVRTCNDLRVISGYV